MAAALFLPRDEDAEREGIETEFSLTRERGVKSRSRAREGERKCVLFSHLDRPFIRRGPGYFALPLSVSFTRTRRLRTQATTILRTGAGTFVANSVYSWSCYWKFDNRSFSLHRERHSNDDRLNANLLNFLNENISYFIWYKNNLKPHFLALHVLIHTLYRGKSFSNILQMKNISKDHS